MININYKLSMGLFEIFNLLPQSYSKPLFFFSSAEHMDSVAHIVLEMDSSFPRFLLDIILLPVNCFLSATDSLFENFTPPLYLFLGTFPSSVLYFFPLLAFYQ